ADLALVPSLAKARRVPASADLARPVSGLALLDAGGPEAPPPPLLSPGAPPPGVPASCAGVVCRVAPDGDLGVPVLVLPAGTPWAAVVADLAAGLVAGGGRSGALAGRGGPR